MTYTSSKFVLLKGHCPICNGEHKSCKQNGELIHCRSQLAPPQGYELIGLDGINFAMYAPAQDRSKSYDFEAARAEREARLAKQARQQEQALKAMPSLEERDRHIREKAQNLTKTQPRKLTTPQNTDLLSRGLTQDEINFAISKHWLFALEGSYGIAAYDPISQLLCGAQKANDDRTKKYTWGVFTGKNKLKETGENPLFVWISPDFDSSKPYQIKYCEGALKSLIRGFFEWRTNPQIIVIGAAAGIFGSNSLERVLSAYPDATNHTLLPDADSQNIKKLNLDRAYGNLAAAIPSLKFAYWQHWQQTKQDGGKDCDETYGTDAFNGYELRSPQDWLNFFKDRANVKSFVDLIHRTADNLTAKPRGFAAKIAPLIENISKNHDNTNHDDILMFEEGDRNKKYADLIKAGHKFILDRSGTGQGKSHDAGLATTKFFNDQGIECKGTVFLSTEYLNPSTKTLENNRVVVPPRHGGQVYGEDQTPSGKPHIKRWDATKDTKPDVVANCPEEHPTYGAFTIARRKSIPIEALKTTVKHGDKQKEVNKICARCPMLWNCNFKEARKEALTKADLIMHPQSQPDLFDGKIAIVDEADKTLVPTDKTSASKAQILEAAHWLKNKSPDASVIIDPIFNAIATALDNLNGENYHGLDKAKLLSMLGPLPDAATAIAIADEITGLMLPDTFEESDRVNLDGVLELPQKPRKQTYTQEINQQIKILNLPKSLIESDADYQHRLEAEKDRITNEITNQYNADVNEWEMTCMKAKKSAKALQRTANNILNREGKSVMLAQIESTPHNIIEPLLRAIATNGSIYLSRDNDGTKLNVALPNLRQQAQMKSYDATIFQSATMTATDLRARLGLPDDYPIVEIAQNGTFDIISNLKVIQVKGIGNTLRRISNNQKAKLEALKAYAIAKHGNTAVIGYKALNDAFYFGKHDRGTNQFSGMPSMIAAGIPLQNLGDKLAEYQVLINPDASANSDSFMAWYYQQAIAQMTQTDGRQRASLYPNEQFVFYIATDIPLPKILGGAEVTQTNISELCPEMATVTSENKKKVYHLVKNAIAEGIKVTQNLIADALQITQQAVSKTYGLFIELTITSINLGVNLEPISANDKLDVDTACVEIRDTLDSEKTVTEKLKSIFDWTLYNIDDQLFRHVWAWLGSKYQSALLRLIGGLIPHWLTS